MKKEKNKIKKAFYLSTSIAYANDYPHIGFALESIQADVIARYNLSLGKKVFFLTGTDEHGIKIARKAEKENISSEKFVDNISKKFQELEKVLNLSTNDFIRTTDQKRHWPVVEKVWLELERNKDIYKKKYQGLYCVGCEAFVNKKDLVNGKCIYHKSIEPEIIEEENYFFKLSKHSKKIEKILREDKIKIIPKSKKNEILSFISKGLEDVSFSRSRKNLSWGIPVPNDDSQVIYVWADALINYISAINYGKSEFNNYWPADVHFIGKDIFKFHALIWPGILLSLKLPLPKNIFVHGFITVDDQKMSKSLGNIINPFELVDKYGTDPVRYFLLREIPPTEDGDFTYEKFENRYNSDLASGVGNLLARVITMANKSNFKFSNSKKKSNSIFQTKIKKTQHKYRKTLDNFKFNEALIVVWELISFCDKYIEKEKPWEIPSSDSRLEKILINLFYSLEQIAELLKPFLPETSEKILKQIKTQKSEPLFPRLK